MKAYIFPGQGSQVKGMGGELFDEYKELIAKADGILGYSIKNLCLEDPENKLGETQYTQPALYVVNALTFMKKVKEAGEKISFFAGHSLGEYDALLAGGAFDFETGLKLVQKRGELMSKATGGGMAAIIGVDEEKIKELITANNLNSIEIANYNCPSQTVISGLKEDIEKAGPVFKEAGVRLFIPLKVSGAFHSSHMKKAAEEYRSFLENFTFSELTIPVIANVNARPYKNAEIKNNLYEQMTNSVRWSESIRYIMGKGIMEFDEIGPGEVLKGLVQRIKKEAEPLIVNDEEPQLTMNTQKSADAVAADVISPTIGGSITAEMLGNAEYKKDYNLRYAYIAGAMYRGIASKELVVAMGKAGMLGFLGCGSMPLNEIENSIRYIQENLVNGEAYGCNLLSNPIHPHQEETVVDLFIRNNVKVIEAAAYMQMTPALIKYRLIGLERGANGEIVTKHKIQAKISRPEVAELFLSPAPERIVNKLLEEGKVSKEQVELAKLVPVADDLCTEADSGGHTDMGVAYALMPAMLKLRDDMMKKFGYKKKVRVGAAGGIGTPEAAAAAFMLGADFIVTGSINQCTVEAKTSDVVKDLLQQANVQDTEYAPAGDMFEMGAKVQVLRKGLFFPARANKLYDLYQHYNSLDEIDDKTKKQLEEKYFKKSFAEIFAETKEFFKAMPEEIEKAERNPKHKMALIFRWYFGYSTNLALAGKEDCRVDFQVHCGPALGAFNQWVKGTELEDWRKRNVADIGIRLMKATADYLQSRFAALYQQQ